MSIQLNAGLYEFLDEFITYLQKTKTKKLSKASVNQYLNYIKSYLQYHDIDIVPYKFKKRVMLPKIPQEDAQAIDETDTRTILLQCHNRRLKTYLLVLASSGTGPMEACAIRVCDINFDSTPVQLHVRAEYTKTKKSREIFISDETARWLKEWIEFRFGIALNKTKKIDSRISESLVFQVYSIDIRRVTPRSIYQKLVQQFHKVLTAVGFDQRKDSMPQNRTITLHSFRRFVKTTISNQAGADYSEWILGHKKSSYYTVKHETRAEIYSTKCMKYLTFLEYSTLQATGRNNEAKIKELEKQNRITNQKHEQEIHELRESDLDFYLVVKLYISTELLNSYQRAPNEIKIHCKRCLRTWLYRGKSEFVVSCPRCKTSIYIHKKLRLLKESRSEYGSPYSYLKKKELLDDRSDSSVTSSNHQSNA